MTSINQKLVERKENYEKILEKMIKMNDGIDNPFDNLSQQDLWLIKNALLEAIMSIEEMLKDLH